ncbi:hypothetical protein C0995_011250 [Termitomyces sp. Mi166|nr:hypothetical protein C0995_011250 [Termitomyces sp. Mi166\
MDKTVQYLTDVSPYPSRELIEILFPTTVESIVDTFKKFVAENPVSPGKKTIVIIDAIVSNPGVKFLWKELVAICKQARNGVVDYANYFNVSSGKLFWRYQQPSLFTTAKALKFRRWLGGEEKISAYFHDLAVKGGKRLAEIFNTEVMDPDGSFTWNMVNVELQGLDGVGPSSTISRRSTEKLLREHNAYSVSFYHNGRWWTRCSVQIWNELDDFEKIGLIWLQVIKEVLHELIPEKRRDLVGYSTTSDFYRDL